MSETNEIKATKVRATLLDGILTFPTTSNTFDIKALFPDYTGMNDAQQYIVEYGCKQCFQDAVATEPKEGTKASFQKARMDLILSGKRPCKAAKVVEPSITLSSLEGNALKLAVSTKSDVPINTLLALGAITAVRHAQLHAEFLQMLDAISENEE